jgi:hypothetical protein
MCRSNYFKVKNPEAFKEWCNKLHLDVHESTNDNTQIGMLMIHPDNMSESGWPFNQYDEELEDWVEIDFTGELAEHLADKQVAVLIEIGYEKLRYLIGVAIAVAWNGEIKSISLDDIYKLAEYAWDVEVTDASY